MIKSILAKSDVKALNKNKLNLIRSHSRYPPTLIIEIIPIPSGYQITLFELKLS